MKPGIEGYRAGALAALPLALPIGALAVLFGASASGAGLSRAVSVAMSALTFAGSPQFAALSLSAERTSIVVVGAIVACIAGRFALMSFMASPALDGSWLRRTLLAQLVVDETWAIAYHPNGRGFDRGRLIGSGLLLYVVHVGGTALGAIAVSTRVQPSRWGLDAALPALFSVLVWPHLQRSSGQLVAVVSVALTLMLTPIAPPGLPILAGASAALLGRSR